MNAGKEVTGTRKPRAEIQATRRTYTTFDPQTKYAIWRVMGALNGLTLKTLVCEALRGRGWDRARIQREYLAYAMRCDKRGEENLFPGGRV